MYTYIVHANIWRFVASRTIMYVSAYDWLLYAVYNILQRECKFIKSILTHREIIFHNFLLTMYL